MNYQYFADALLAASYMEMNKGRQGLSAGELLDLYELDGRAGWIEAALDEFAARGWVEHDPTLGDERQLTILLRGRGFRAAEQIIESGIKPREKQTVPPGITEISRGRTYIVEGDVPSDFGGPGDVFFEVAPRATVQSDEIAALESKLAPASDRKVNFDLNTPQLVEALEKLDQAMPAIEASNDPAMVEVAVHARTGLEFLKRCRDRAVSTSLGVIRILVIDPFKKALESTLEDGWKAVIQAGLLLLLGVLISVMGLS